MNILLKIFQLNQTTNQSISNPITIFVETMFNLYPNHNSKSKIRMKKRINLNLNQGQNHQEENHQ
jgi:hypothetical protein